MTEQRQTDDPEATPIDSSSHVLEGSSTRRSPHLTSNLQPFGEPLTEGRGCFVRDANGDTYLDGCSQTLNLALGHRPAEVESAVRNQLGKLHYGSSRYLHRQALALVERLAAITPESLERFNPKITSGSEANEGAIKAARKVHGRQGVASPLLSFFGVSVETMRASGKYFELGYLGNDSDYVHFAPPHPRFCPYHEEAEPCTRHCAAAAEEVLEESSVAALMIEPIMVDTGGVIIPPDGYLSRLREICDTHDVALVFDEDQTSFGWLGTFFAADYFGVQPDMMTFGKALANGFPLSVLAMDPVYDVLEYGEHEFTTGAHPISCAAAHAVLDVVTSDGFLESVNRRISYFGDRLREVVEGNAQLALRQCGFIAGIECEVDSPVRSSRLAVSIMEEARKRGLLIRLSHEYRGNVVILKPPITISREEIDLLVERLDGAIHAASARQLGK